MSHHLEDTSSDETTTNNEMDPENFNIEEVKKISEKESNNDSRIVEFSTSDPSNPREWTHFYKWMVILVLCNCSLCVTCTSSVISNAYSGIEEEFNIGAEVATLGLSLFVLGLSLGPLLFGPLSEFYGRRPIYLYTYAAFLLLGLPVAFANNTPVFMIFRFLTGVSGSAFLSVAGGSVYDCFSPKEVGIPMAVYTAAPFFGPVLGPVFSGFINQHTSWRWSFWMITCWSSVNMVLIYFFSPETFSPIILSKKAKDLGKEGKEEMVSNHDLKMKGKSVTQTILISSNRVFLMLMFEPILLLLCIWSALLLSILYCFFGAFQSLFLFGLFFLLFNFSYKPQLFQAIVFAQHNFNLQSIGLSFLGIAIGMFLTLLSSPFWKNRYLKTLLELESKGEKVPPEERLDQASLGAFLSVIGLFCFAFTSYKNVHWIAPIISSIPFGAAIILIFSSVFTYTSDLYGPSGVAASALCANSFVRCLSSAAFPLFTRQMYHTLNPVGASALLAGLNVLMIPLPFVFYRYGARIRARSRFAT